MSGGNIDVPSPPVVIVRRKRGSSDDEHHGGVWKIAYADFMTAMMAFFLVMWLVNAADKKTITQVAAYFNPIRLTDRTPSTKGLDEAIDGEQEKPVKTQKEAKHSKNGKEIEKEGAEKMITDEVSEAGAKLLADKSPDAASPTFGEAEKEAKLFSDPMGVLDKLAEKAKLTGDDSAKKNLTPRSEGTVIRDPFDPAQRSGSEKAKPPTELAKKSNETLQQQTTMPPSGAPSKDAGKEASLQSKSAVQQNTAPSESKAAKEAKDAKNTKDAKANQAAEAANAIDKEIHSALASTSGEGPTVEVKATPEGLLVSLVDDANFGMFEIGSAEPRPEVVGIMEKIAGVLKNKSGRIIVRGHTDGRQYRNGSYDNWRLSSDRAQMSFYMLVRGGIDQARIDAIEGRADRDLRIPTDAGAAQNRRIDILIKESAP